MSAYDELVERCAKAVTDRNNYSREAAVAAVLAEVLRTLETVTPEMIHAWHATPEHDSGIDRDWLAMLRASPLAPPK